MSKDYYEILGVSKTASKDEIKKAFRKLAHEHHPDMKGGDEAKFKEANEAYSVLSDDTKRQQYDTYGKTFSQGGGGGAGGFEGFDFSGFANGQGFSGFQDFDVGDIFGDLFGGGRQQQKRGRDISVDIEISFEESIFGTEKTIHLNKTSTCDVCVGSGAEKGSDMVTCSICNGKGKVQEVKKSFIGSFATVKMCENCHGKGKVPKKKCSACSGAGVYKREQVITIKVPAGIDNNEMLRLTNAGEAKAGDNSGDLYVKIHVENHNIFRKENADLVMDLKIKLSDAILGAEYNIKTLDGDIVLKIPEGINNGEILRVRGKGVPVGKKRGDILVNIVLDMPKKLSRKAREAIESLRNEGI